MALRDRTSGWRGWIAFFLISLLAVLAYQRLSSLWVPLGTDGWTIPPGVLSVEIPLMLLFSGFLYFPEIRSVATRYLVPLAVLFVLYTLFDLFYLYLLRSPRPSDFQNISALLDFSPGLGAALLLYALLAPLLVLLLVLLAGRAPGGRGFRYRLLLRISLLGIVLTTLSTEAFNTFHARLVEHVEWSEGETIHDNGRLSSYIYFANLERMNSRALKRYRAAPLDIHAALYPGIPVRPRNIHIVILESFVDPRLIDGALFRRDPLSEKLRPYLLQSEWEFSHVYSPEYGGGTAQVEFELLTGIKAYEGVGTISFNAMEGGRMHSFVERLRQLGYSTMATVATGPDYFNSRMAYRSLGLDPVLFLEEQDDIARQEDDAFIFDGDLLQYNLEKFREFRKSGTGLVLNYVLGMYGHVPYERNLEKRPDIVEVTHPDDRVRRIANQFHYRTEALAEYLDALLAIDPESIVFVCSDHVPPILGKQIEYLFDRYRNIGIFLLDGEPLEMSGKEYFEIPWAIWDILRDRDYDEREVEELDMEALYFKVMSQTLKE
jgi:hypothetical protein